MSSLRCKPTKERNLALGEGDDGGRTRSALWQKQMFVVVVSSSVLVLRTLRCNYHVPVVMEENLNSGQTASLGSSPLETLDSQLGLEAQGKELQ